MLQQTMISGHTPEWKMITELPDLSEATIISIDTETKDPYLRAYKKDGVEHVAKGPGAARGDGFIVGVSIATDKHDPFYIPLNHAGENWPDQDQFWKWLKEQLSDNRPKVGANIFYDLIWLRRYGVEVKGKKYDVQIAEALLNENRTSYSLESISQDRLGVGKDESFLEEYAKSLGVDPKGDMDKLPAWAVGQYAEIDTLRPLQLWPIQYDELVAENLLEPFYLETELIDLLVDLHWRGILIDKEKAEQLAMNFKAEEEVLKVQVSDLMGFEVDVWSNDSLDKAYAHIGVTPGRTATGKASVTQEWLSNQEDELSRMVKRIRKINKVRGTFLENSILEKIDSNNRIHPQFLQVRGEQGGTRSYRFASISPNLQQMPARDEELGPMIRSLFLPEPGHKLLAADYSSQEIKIGHHLAITCKHTGYEGLLEAYSKNDKIDFHQLVADWTGLPRKTAKVLNLSIQYGAGKYKIANMLGVSVQEATNILAQYHTNVPFIRELMDKISSVASSRGYIVEIGGRRLRFNEYEPDVYWNDRPKEAPFQLPLEKAREKWAGTRLKRAGTFKALNRWIQSSAATQTKKAMLQCWKEGFLCHLTVHDELVFSIKTKEEAYRIKQIMEEAQPFAVKSVVDLEWGPNWGQMEAVG